MGDSVTIVTSLIVRSPDSFSIPEEDAETVALEAAVKVQLLVPFDVDRATKEAIIEKANRHPVFIVSLLPEEQDDLRRPALKNQYAAAINWLRMQLIAAVQLVWLGMLVASASGWVQMKFATAIGWCAAAIGWCAAAFNWLRMGFAAAINWMRMRFTAAIGWCVAALGWCIATLGSCPAALCCMWMRSAAARDWMRIRCAAAFDCIAASFNWLRIQYFEALGWLGMPSWTIILMLVILTYYVRSLFEDTLSSLNTLRRVTGLLIFVCILRGVVIKSIEIDDAISKWRKGDH